MAGLAAFLRRLGGPKLTALHLHVGASDGGRTEAPPSRLLEVLLAGESTYVCSQGLGNDVPGLGARVERAKLRAEARKTINACQHAGHSAVHACSPSCRAGHTAQQLVWLSGDPSNHVFNLPFAAPSPMAHVRVLTLALEPSTTAELLLAPRWRERENLQRLLAACTSLRRLHLHFQLRQTYVHTLEHLWQRYAAHARRLLRADTDCI